MEASVFLNSSSLSPLSYGLSLNPGLADSAKFETKPFWPTGLTDYGQLQIFFFFFYVDVEM